MWNCYHTQFLLVMDMQISCFVSFEWLSRLWQICNLIHLLWMSPMSYIGTFWYNHLVYIYIYCRTANFRVQEIFANFVNFAKFAKISCTWILPDTVGTWANQKFAKISCTQIAYGPNFLSQKFLLSTVTANSDPRNLLQGNSIKIKI